jgi:peroxiredoxin
MRALKRIRNKAQIKAGRVLRITVSALLLTGAMYASAATLTVGDKAPDFEVTTLTGEDFKLSDYKGDKPVYIKFWATWCRYCKAEMPHLQSIYNKYGDDVEILAVNVGINDSVENIEQFFNRGGFNLPVVFDQRGDLVSAYGVVGTPHHVLIDKEGVIAYRTFLASDTLDEILEGWALDRPEEISKKDVKTMKRKQWKR